MKNSQSELLKNNGKIIATKIADKSLSQLRKTVSKLKGSFKSQNLQQKLQIPLGGYNGKD
jgi:hypothetical protein